MEFAVQVLDICVHWDDAVDFYTGSSCLQDYLPDLIPPLYADLPGKKYICNHVNLIHQNQVKHCT